MVAFSKNDVVNMARALRLAACGRYGVGGNPMVGCVISRAGEVVADGYHQKFGGGHAEVEALNKIDGKADGATIYVNLEPCAHFGKTPPCVDAIIKSGVRQVIIASSDPNPLVAGKGIMALEKAKIEVKVGLLEAEANQLNRGFIKRMHSKKPFVTCKIAMSLDGKIAMSSGESRWISGEKSRLDAHKLRMRSDAILTGSGTILADNPHFTVRLDEVKNQPLRAVIDGKNQITDPKLNIFSSVAKTIIFNPENTKIAPSGKLNLDDVLIKLGEMGINNVLLEAGAGMNAAMIEAGLVDEIVIYSAPILLGSEAISALDLPLKLMAEKICLDIKDMRIIGNDLKIIATPKKC